MWRISPWKWTLVNGGSVCKTYFQKLRDEQKDAGNAPWYPFESEDEWELAKWLMTSGLSQKKTDEYLKLKAVRERMKPSFSNNRTFLKFVDALPPGPQWYCHAFELEGDELDGDQNPKKETVEMWYRDPLECVKELLGNPSFAGKQGYKPIRVFKRFKDGQYSNREFTEMWTADWWWEIQLTRFSGDQQAWPVYLTIGNIEKETRRSPSSRATILIGYIPVTKLEIFSKAKRSTVTHQLFHDCMRVILEPLRAAGVDGEKMDCADADYPEQCLVACCRENSCPRCLVRPKQRGEPVNSPLRDPGETLRLHNGVFGDHIVKWSTQAIAGKDGEVDRRFRAMTPHPSLRHFKKGISLTSQWTGNERKHMEKVFLGILAQATDPAVQRALKIRKNFDINKLHKLKHCVDSIRSRGTADGFNTENTERLHIDFAKAGYRATNKVRYTRQMTVWLARQEAVYRFGTYLQWADDDEKEGELEAAPLPNDPNGDDEELDDTATSSSSSYRLPKNPSFPRVSVATIISDFHAPRLPLQAR
ncbi:hypothetical protein B0H14DRAFT_3112207 [Mycena olivaceomarginata]|nr:hypothetical protein B0H14DRAFT_3112207 [Mycena olivaceomarginata]